MSLTIDLTQLPEFQAMQRQIQTMTTQIADLQNALPEWVDQVEAERLTGLSETTLWRERKRPVSLIIWKSDRGVRYLRSSLIDHNNRRTLGGGK